MTPTYEGMSCEHVLFGTMMHLLYENISKIAKPEEACVHLPKTRNIENSNVLFLRTPALYGAVLTVVNANGILQEDKVLFPVKNDEMCAEREALK